MASVLYISYTGLTDPLGASQVLQYVLALGRSGHRMTVLSFEKPQALAGSSRMQAIRTQCEEAGVNWHPRVWHNKPLGAVATIYDIIFGSLHAVRLARRVGADVIHCRSYIAGLIGLVVKRATGARHIFDMRGFWPDERVDGGIWRSSSLVYKFFKRVEKWLFTGADHVVSLTRAGVREFEKFDYLMGCAPCSSVIPTCTNLELFTPGTRTDQSGFTLGYVGSVGSWYLFDAVAEVVKRVFEIRPDARLLVVTQSSHDLVRDTLSRAGVDRGRVEVRAAGFGEVPNQIARMDAGVFFIRPAWSKRASCPTRMGEFLACGKPCLTNSGVGDVGDDINATGTGVVLPSLGLDRVDMSGLDVALHQLFAMSADPETPGRCRKAAEERFSLTKGVAEYDRIYRRLSGDRS